MVLTVENAAKLYMSCLMLHFQRNLIDNQTKLLHSLNIHQYSNITPSYFIILTNIHGTFFLSYWANIPKWQISSPVIEQYYNEMYDKERSASFHFFLWTLLYISYIVKFGVFTYLLITIRTMNAEVCVLFYKWLAGILMKQGDIIYNISVHGISIINTSMYFLWCDNIEYKLLYGRGMGTIMFLFILTRCKACIYRSVSWWYDNCTTFVKMKAASTNQYSTMACIFQKVRNILIFQSTVL